MAKENSNYERYCPGEEHIKLSDSVCLGRRRANFFKCPGCQFNDDEKGTQSFAATVVGKRILSNASHAKDPSVDSIDKVFKAYDVRAVYPEPLSENIAWRIGNATSQFLRTTLSGYDRSDAKMNKLIVGRDMRKHSPALSAAFIEGARAVGTEVVDIGMIDTSQIYFATNHMPCCGAVQTTASHNPAEYNGFKIAGLKGKPVGQDSGLGEIQRMARAIARYPTSELGKLTKLDLSEPYREYLHKFLTPPRPLKIVVDASNGMAGKWFPILFDGVPNLEVIKLNFEHDGTFKHPPNPLVEANLVELKAAMKQHGADFGACFDGDADRCIFVDEACKTVACDMLTALLASEYLRDNPGATIVYDLRSSRIVADIVRKNEGVPRRERVGHVFMKRTMAETDAIFGGELSGHFYFRDFFYCDSGMLVFIAMLNVLTRTNMKLSELIDPFKVYANSGERNFENPDKDGTFREIMDRYKDGELDTLDGVTVQYEDWWFNVRASNTEPLLRLNMEANTQELLDEKLAELTPLLGKPVEH
ncbi:MAG: phosphomannomutase/phosphoglucomutase [Phycisphaerae bacterium]